MNNKQLIYVIIFFMTQNIHAVRRTSSALTHIQHRHYHQAQQRAQQANIQNSRAVTVYAAPTEKAQQGS